MKIANFFTGKKDINLTTEVNSDHEHVVLTYRGKTLGYFHIGESMGQELFVSFNPEPTHNLKIEKTDDGISEYMTREHLCFWIKERK